MEVKTLFSDNLDFESNEQGYVVKKIIFTETESQTSKIQKCEV